MRQAGKLDEVVGVIFGEMAGCTAGADESVTVLDVSFTQHCEGGPTALSGRVRFRPAGETRTATMSL